jgi:hypothetical protein
LPPFEVKPPTGEPDAGDPPVRFEERGIRVQSILPTPIVEMTDYYSRGYETRGESGRLAVGKS